MNKRFEHTISQIDHAASISDREKPPRRMRLRKLRVVTGSSLILSFCGIPALAHTSMPIPSRALGQSEMDRTVTDVQRNTIFRMLDEVMAIMRDDKSFDPEDGTFGNIRNTRTQPGYPGMSYSFKNTSIPPATIEFVTASNPLDYSEDRMRVPVVPTYFKLDFSPSIYGITEDMLKQRLDLADYWIDRDGKKREGNMMPPPGPGLLMKPYRYRAKAHANSRFPVDVEIVFGLPTGDEPKDKLVLMFLTIERAYPFVTPEDRKRMREEKEQRVRELYNSPGKGAAQ